tara:strand:- start:125 stop:355 length:231 start_codon:yes stop_codon:yes gene_type:complete
LVGQAENGERMRDQGRVGGVQLASAMACDGRALTIFRKVFASFLTAKMKGPSGRKSGNHFLNKVDNISYVIMALLS